MKCAMCNLDIPEKCPSDDFCSSSCQRIWQEGNADWPSWEWSWNGKNRKTLNPKVEG